MPLAIDLFCGLGGWTEGLLAENYRVIGFDIEQHVYGEHRYPSQLVLQDVLTLHGSQFKDADLIVASPPCQEYSYMAMPWKLAKAKAAAIRADTTGKMLADLNRLFEACFRLQAQASLAAGRHIPLVVENVRGAIPWVGRSRWNFGSFHLWGDVPALMPMTHSRKLKGGDRNLARASGGHKWDTEFKVPGFRFDGSGGFFQSASVEETGYKSRGMNWSDPTLRGQDFTRIAGNQAIKNNGGSWFNIAHNTTSGKGRNPDGRKGGGGTWFHEYGPDQGTRNFSSKSPARKFASAMIAKIPLQLSRHIARTYQDIHKIP